MSQGTVQNLAHQLKDLFVREPESHVEFNLHLSPVAHVLLGPSPDALHMDTAPNAVVQENATAIPNEHLQSTQSVSTHGVLSGPAGEQGGPRRSSRATKGTKKSWSQDVGTHDVHHPNTMTSSTTTGVADSLSQCIRSGNELPSEEASGESRLPAHDRESAATIPSKVEGKIQIYEHREANRANLVGSGELSTINSHKWPVVAAYPPSLASRWSPSQNTSKVVASDLHVRKRPRVGAMSLQLPPVPVSTGHGQGNVVGNPIHSEQAAPSDFTAKDQKFKSFIVARDNFRSRWAPVFPAFTDWARLDRYETAGKKRDQAPYEELDRLMTRLCKIGTPSVQTAFAYGVTKWLASPYASGQRIETPRHLLHIPGFDAAPFQKFWLAEEMARSSKGVEDMSIILRRKALADFLCAYYEVVAHVRHNAAQGKLQLGHGERAAAEARKILYEIIYPDLESRSRARSFFNSSQTRGGPYYKLQKRYGSIGILAMIPTKMGEAEFRASDSLFNIFLELLNIFRPELHDPARLKVYGTVIDTISSGDTPDADLMQELSSLTSPQQFLRADR